MVRGSVTLARLLPWPAALVVASMLIGPSLAAPFRFGTEADDAPFASVGPHGATGFSIDIGNDLCKRLKLRCEWIGLRFTDLIPALLDHRIDAAISQISVTPARSAKVMFTEPVTSAGGILIVPELSSITNSLASMKGKTVGVQTGTTHQVYAQQMLGKIARVRLYPTQAQAFAALAAGQVDATLCDMDLGHQWLEQHSGSFRFADGPVVDPAIYGSQTAIALRPGSVELKRRFDAAIDAMMSDGTFTDINQKYFTFSIAPGRFGGPL